MTDEMVYEQIYFVNEIFYLLDEIIYFVNDNFYDVYETILV